MNTNTERANNDGDKRLGEENGVQGGGAGDGGNNRKDKGRGHGGVRGPRKNVFARNVRMF